MDDKKVLSYSLHLSNDKNKSKKAIRSIKNTETSTTFLSNNAIQNHQQLSKVDKHNLRKYDDDKELICTIKGTSSIVEDTKNLYLELFEDARIKYNEKQNRNDTESYRDECNRFFALFKLEIDHQYFHDSGNRQADKQEGYAQVFGDY